MKNSYIKGTEAYWKKGYFSPNVESHFFRVFGRIFEWELKFGKKRPCKVLDFGCGEGAALLYLYKKGYDVYGVDISPENIEICRQTMPKIKSHFKVIDSLPKQEDLWFGGKFDFVTSVQTLYYLNLPDFNVRMQNLYSQMKRGAWIYTTMMGTRHWYYDYAKPAGAGLWKIDLKCPRFTIKDYYLSFVKSEKEMLQRFALFKKRHLGYYAAKYRDDEGEDFHYTFVGQKVSR